MKKIKPIRKKTFLTVIFCFLVIILIIAAFLLIRHQYSGRTTVKPAPAVIEYMTTAEKEKLNLSQSPDVNPSRIQVLERDARGDITAYKLINSDRDLIILPTARK